MTRVVDRNFAVDEILEGLALPAATIMPAASLGWDESLVPRPFSVSEAKTFMEAAGFDYADLTTDSSGAFTSFFFEVTVLSPNTNPARNQWSANYVLELPKIGIKVAEHVSTGWAEIAPRTFNRETLPPAYVDGGYDVFFVGYSGALDWNPSGSYETSGSCETGTCGNFLNFDLDGTMTDFNTLVPDYLSELDFEKRNAKAKLIQAEMYKWIPEMPILYPQSHWGWTDKLSGVDSLLISTSSQEWNLVKLEGFTKNVVDTKTLETSEDNGVPFSTFAVVSAIFFTALIATYKRRR
ncbi:MAG: ABC transporter substrate-binding protein, partial [Candidatus Heimdallarchaeota archaeon]